MAKEKDWKGTTSFVFKSLGASSHCEHEREPMDFYATDPSAVEKLLEVETFDRNIWECACGQKHISGVLEAHGYNVRSSDIVDRCGNEVYDFLSMANTQWEGDIVTNPPYKHAQAFVEKALSIIPDGNKVCMLLRIQFLEGKARRELYRVHPPKVVRVFASRTKCHLNGVFNDISKSAIS